jgi:hypothetical protein
MMDKIQRFWRSCRIWEPSPLNRRQHRWLYRGQRGRAVGCTTTGACDGTGAISLSKKVEFGQPETAFGIARPAVQRPTPSQDTFLEGMLAGAVHGAECFEGCAEKREIDQAVCCSSWGWRALRTGSDEFSSRVPGLAGDVAEQAGCPIP